MKPATACAAAAIAMLVSIAASAADLKDQIKVQTDPSEKHAGMQAGSYVCAAGHLHVKATVQNNADVAVGSVKVAGKALDADGKVIGTATAATRQPVIHPRESAPIDMEFETVTGPLIQKVKSEELAVVSVSKR
jgi:hypothetical protein